MISKEISIYYQQRLLINAVLSVCQVIVFGFTYFVLYSLLLRTLGPAKLGMWSLILSTSSVANIANLGISSSLVNYITLFIVEKDTLKINNLIKTGLISIAVFMGIIAVIIYISARYMLPSFIGKNELSESLILLPLSLTSLWLQNIGSILLSAIDGFQYTSIRSIIYILSSLLFLILAYVLISNYGLVGIAIAQITQAFCIVIFSLIGLKIIFKEFSLFPFLWDKQIFKQIFKISANFQIISLLQMFYDPTTKILLSKFGGLDFVGFYEMASRVVIQIRSLIVSANQVIVPTVATQAHYSNNSSNDFLYPKVFNLIIITIFPLVVAFVLFAPYISYYWIGRYEPLFIYSIVIISIAYLLNTLCVPAYFSNIGLGNLKSIVYAHIVMAIINALLGFFGGYFFGGWGVIISFAIMLLVGASIMLQSYHSEQDIKFKSIIKKDFYNIIAYSLLTCISSILIFALQGKYIQPLYLLLLNLLLFLVYLFILLKNNEYANLILRKIKRIFKKDISIL